jgi:SAM-dependent methyltransferase
VRKDSRRLLGVGEPTGLRRYAQVFDAVAADYDVHRPGYPGELVDSALRRGGLAAGARVLEIGCGTGKLTELLAARGLRIDAVDPGAKLIEAARRRVGDAPNVTFHLGRFEDVELPEDTYDAAFSAAAFHWVEPSVGWEKVACHLRADGLLALLTYLGVTDGATPGVEMELFTVLEEHAPELAADWGPAHDVASLLAATSARADNVSAVWDVVLSRVACTGSRSRKQPLSFATSKRPRWFRPARGPPQSSKLSSGQRRSTASSNRRSEPPSSVATVRSSLVTADASSCLRPSS